MGAKELALATGILGALLAGVLARPGVSPRHAPEEQEQQVLTPPRAVAVPLVAEPSPQAAGRRAPPARLLAPGEHPGQRGGADPGGPFVTVFLGASLQPPGGLLVLVLPQGTPAVR